MLLPAQVRGADGGGNRCCAAGDADGICPGCQLGGVWGGAGAAAGSREACADVVSWGRLGRLVEEWSNQHRKGEVVGKLSEEVGKLVCLPASKLPTACYSCLDWSYNYVYCSNKVDYHATTDYAVSWWQQPPLTILLVRIKAAGAAFVRRWPDAIDLSACKVLLLMQQLLWTLRLLLAPALTGRSVQLPTLAALHRFPRCCCCFPLLLIMLMRGLRLHVSTAILRAAASAFTNLGTAS